MENSKTVPRLLRKESFSMHPVIIVHNSTKTHDPQTQQTQTPESTLKPTYHRPLNILLKINKQAIIYQKLLLQHL